MSKQLRINRLMSTALLTALIGLFEASAVAAVPKKISKAPKYNVSMRIGLKGSTPFSVSTVAKSGKKNSITEISSDGQTETLVEMTPRKFTQNQKSGLLIDVKVTRTFRGDVKASEKAQIFAYENEEVEMRVGATSKGRQDLSLAVMANPIVL